LIFEKIQYLTLSDFKICLFLGAKFGIKSIPEDWMARVDGIEEILKIFEKV